VIRLRVTEAEAQLFKIKTAEAGCKSISEYIRSRCIGEDDEHDKRDSGVDKTAVKETKKKKSAE